MKTTEIEPLLAAPLLLSALRKGQEEFEIAAMQFARARQTAAMDPANEECLELLDHLVKQLGEPGPLASPGMEEACIYLLEHLSARIKQRQWETEREMPIQ